MHSTAFFLGLISLGLVTADVSHLRQNNQQQAAGHTFRGSVKSYNSNHGDTSFSYNSAGNDPNNENRYWWMNTDTPFTQPKQQQQNYNNNYLSAAGCNGCASRTLNLKHNTQQHEKHQNSYSQKSFTNVKQSPSPITSRYSIVSTPISGSQQGANNNFFGRVQQQQSSSCADSNSACVMQKHCLNGFIDQSAENKAVRSSSGRCYSPEVCCRFAQRRNAPLVLDNTFAAANERSTSEVLTKEGYVVNKPTNQYLPSYDPQPTNNDQSYIRPAPRPQPPRTQPQRPQQPYQQPYQPQPSNQRPQYDEAPIVIPVGCAAALNCTNIQYCTASGVISKSPVSLTPDQEMFRVPLTDCREPTTKEVGKCCRDPDYVDPWPVGRTGQYVAEEINGAFDSGAYKPEPSNQQPVRVMVRDQGYVIPQPSNKQNRLYLPPNRI